MSSILIPPRIQFIDKNGEPIVNGKVYTYEAGTSVPKVSWKDQQEVTANTNPVILDDAGRAQIWIRGSYKIVVHDSDDVLIYEDDDVISYTDVDFTGLTATIADLNSTNTSGILITNNYSVQESDRGKTILANAASTSLTVNLLPVTTATNRYRITIKKIDLSGNEVTIDPNSTELIEGSSEYVLYDFGDFIEILCDGSTWHLVAAQIRGTIITESSSFSIDLEDHGKIFNCDTSGGNVIVTLPAVATLGTGFESTFKKIDSSGNSIIINADGAETIDGAASLQIEGQNFAYTIKTDSLDWYIISDVSTGSTGLIPNDYISGGLITSQVAPDPAHDIQITPGVFANSTNLKLFELGSTLIKEINNTWAEGNLAGGLAAALTLSADTWYHIFMLAKANGEVDAGFDTSLTATNLLADSAVQLAGYLYYRRIASVKTDGSSNIKDYHQTYDTFLWDDPDNLVSLTGVSGVQTIAVDVPSGFRVESLLNLVVEGVGGTYAYSYSPFLSDLTPSATTNPLFTLQRTAEGGGGGIYQIITDDSQQIKQNSNSVTVNYKIITLGWKDWRVD